MSICPEEQHKQTSVHVPCVFLLSRLTPFSIQGMLLVLPFVHPPPDKTVHLLTLGLTNQLSGELMLEPILWEPGAPAPNMGVVRKVILFRYGRVCFYLPFVMVVFPVVFLKSNQAKIKQKVTPIRRRKPFSLGVALYENLAMRSRQFLSREDGVSGNKELPTTARYIYIYIFVVALNGALWVVFKGNHKENYHNKVLVKYL